MKSIAILFVCLAVVKGYPRNSRIIGGTEADIKDYPSLVSITFKDEHICGGFIYNERFVVTTTGCIQGYKNDTLNLNVYAGQINLILPDAHEQRKGVRQIYTHESYEDKTKINDIALVELTNPFDVTSTPEVAVGIFDEVDIANGNVTARFAGWGAVQVGGFPSVVLQQTSLTILVLGAECQVYGDSDFQTNIMICASPEIASNGTVVGAYPCQYDEGSPLLQKVVDGVGNDFTAVVGIMSKNKGCDADNRLLPTVFTRLSAYYAWLFRIAGSQPPLPTTTPKPCDPIDDPECEKPQQDFKRV